MNHLSRTILILILITGVSGLLAQSTITGQLIDPDGETLPFANVEIYSKLDSSLVAGESTDMDGRFSISIENGEYWLRTSFLSYEPLIIDPLIVDRDMMPLGRLQMEVSSLELDEVVVSSDRTQVEFKLDKRVFNIGKDLRSVGGNAADILDNLPGITVDLEGEVSLRGSNNVRILINGKPSGLSRTQALNQLQASMIERVEVITNPSARYEAEGEVGIINIVLKKNQKKGINGSVDANVGYPDNYGLGLNLNYRRNKVNLFTNLGVRYNKSPGGGDSYQESFSENHFLAFRSDRDRTRGGLGGNSQIGLDWFITPSATLTASVLYSARDSDNESDITYVDLDQQGTELARSYRLDEEIEISHDLESSLNFTKTFGSKDHKWTVDFQYQLNDDTEKNIVKENDEANTFFISQRIRNVEDQSTALFQSDYTLPIGDEGKFETGVRLSLRNVVNEYLVEEEDDNEVWQVLQPFDEELSYTENIYAAYLIYGNKLGQFGYQLGLRTEYSDIATELKKTNDVNPREYLDWFPSAHFTYDITDTDQVQLSYSRRISRPRFRHLIPFYGLSDSRSLWQGNPDLNPEYTNSIELGYLRYLEKGSILSSVYYRQRQDLIQRITQIDSLNISQAFPINLGTQHDFGLELGINYDPFKWLQINWNVNGYYATTEGRYESQDFSAEAYVMTTRLTTKAKMKRGFDAQITFDYRSPQVQAQGKRLSMYGVDLAFSKDVFDKRGTVTFSVRDLFNSRRWRSEVDEENFYRESEWQWRARTMILGFNYLINQDRRKRNGRSGGGHGGGLDIDMGG